ncbi:hypothetical protein EVAR_56100_1 [Eumeta japonica]|uniref:Uncharacterized protein n=1 Tax=Eumeta variegata TaxID=151549 RepID=A0A4C1YGL2_EUMVA|nr:hypothetical protein EVAR_56100_1 [Eumeta japonica]
MSVNYGWKSCLSNASCTPTISNTCTVDVRAAGDVYQCFLLLLVRSIIVNIKEERKKRESEDKIEKQKNTDLELGEESASEQEYEVNQENPAPDYKKLDTLLETSDEESVKNEN